MSRIPAKAISQGTSGEPGLARYLLAAVLIRGANDGAAVGLVLLAVAQSASSSTGGSATGGAAAGGLLVAALNVPHLVGPWIARALDVGRDSRRILAFGFAAYGAALTAAALLLGRVPFALVVGAALLAGCNGPLMGGGLSSRLTTRRALALDSGTWGVATTAGPAAAGLLAALSGPLVALLTLSGVAVAAAAFALTLPRDDRSHPQRPDFRADSRSQPDGAAAKAQASRNLPAEGLPGTEADPRRASHEGHRDSQVEEAGTTDQRRPRVLALMVRHGGLRRVALCTVFTGLGTGAFPVAAPLLCTQLDRPASAGGLLLSAYGFGSLVGSLLTAARPPGGSAIRRACICLVLIALAVAGAASAPTYAVALGCFGLVGLANGPWIAAVLEACRQYSPDEVRAQVFVTTSSLKIGAASLAGACAGLTGSAGGRVILLASTVAFAAAAFSPALDRLLSRPDHHRTDRHAQPAEPQGVPELPSMSRSSFRWK